MNSSNGLLQNVKYSLLNGKSHDGAAHKADSSKPPHHHILCCSRLSRLEQIGFFFILACAIFLIVYKGIWHSSSPHDVFHSLTHELTEVPHDVVWDKIRIKHTKRRLPECLIIGIRKAGTRALLTFLNLHPQIQTAKNEVHFFDNSEIFHNGFEWYRKRMPYSFPGQITMEKTPGYFKTAEAPERVYKMNATIRLLLIVRDPTERAISDYLQMHLKKLSEGKESEKFEYLALNAKGEIDTSYPVLRRSIYYKFMRNWLNYFRLHQFHFIDGENLVRNPLEELRAVERFLGIEHRITSDMFFFNASRGFYCINNSTQQKCLNPSKGRKHPDIEPFVIHKLRKYFRPYNQRFFQMIKREFDWPIE